MDSILVSLKDNDLSFEETEKLLSSLRVITRDKNLDLTTVSDLCNIKILVELASSYHVEAQKCISNLILNYESVRIPLIEPYLECVKLRLELELDPDKEPEKSDVYDMSEIIYYDFRIVFLLSALCFNHRPMIHDTLFNQIFNYVSKELKNYNSKSHPLIIQALKILFNLTIDASKDCKRFDEIIEASLNIIENTDHDPNHATELLVNTIYLLTNLSRSNYEKLSRKNADKILNFFDTQLKNQQKACDLRDSVLPVLNCCTNICKYNESIRDHWYKSIISSTNDFEKRPEQYDSLRGRLVKLMTSVDVHIKDIAADFLYVLCDKDSEKFILYTGLGNAASFLATRGLLGSKNKSSNDEKATTSSKTDEAYMNIRDRIDPITGKLETPKQNTILDSMTEDEKEAQAEELANAIARLSNLGVIKPVGIDADGNMKELKP